MLAPEVLVVKEPFGNSLGLLVAALALGPCIPQAGLYTLDDEAARKWFRKEALALSKLNHPNIPLCSISTLREVRIFESPRTAERPDPRVLSARLRCVVREKDGKTAAAIDFRAARK